MTLRTTRDLVVPAGTEVLSPPSASTRWGKDYEVIVGVDDDHTAYLSLDLYDAIEIGFVADDGMVSIDL